MTSFVSFEPLSISGILGIISRSPLNLIYSIKDTAHLLHFLTRRRRNGTVINHRRLLVTKTKLEMCFALRGERFASSSRCWKWSRLQCTVKKRTIEMILQSTILNQLLLRTKLLNSNFESMWFKWFPLRSRICPVFNFFLLSSMLGLLAFCSRTRTLLRTEVFTIPEEKNQIRVGSSKYQTLSMVLTRASKFHYVHILVVVVWSRDFEITLFSSKRCFVPQSSSIFFL